MAYIDVYGREISIGGGSDVNAPSYQLKLNHADIDRFKGKTLLAIGDSITEKNTKNDYKSWCEYFADWMGMTVINDGKSGTGLLKEYQGMKCFCNRVDLDPDNIYTNAHPDIVLIMGNGNDASGGDYHDYTGSSVTMPIPEGGNASALPIGEKTDTSSALTCYGATRHIFESLINRYPTAQIGWILSTPRLQDVSVRWGGQGLGQMHGKASIMDKYAEAIQYVCEDMNIPCLDLYHNSVLRPWVEDNADLYFADAFSTGLVVHPNTTGLKAGMVVQIIDWVNNNF